MNHMAFDLGSVIAHFKADITGFQNGLKQVESGLSGANSRIKSASDGINSAIVTYGKYAVAAGAAGAVLFGKKALDDAAQYEQQIIALNTLLGSREAAEKQIARIKSDALKTPFDVAGLITANQLLISAGVNADKAETDILNLGDAISANGKGAVELDRIVVNLQQIKNVGKATEMDMKQFAFNGINMYGLLADSTKLPIEKLKDMDITYEMITQALAKASAEGGKYHEANLRQSESLVGLKSNLGDTVQQQLINIAMTTGMFDAAKQFTLQLTAFINDTAPKFISALQTAGAAISTTTKFLMDHKLAVEIVVGLLVGFFIPAIIATGVQSGITATVGLWQLITNTVMYGVEGWKTVAMLGAKIIQMGIATAVFIAHAAATVATTVATTAMTVATWLLNAALAVLTSPILLVIAAIVALIAIGYLLIKNWDAVKEFGANMLDFLGRKFNEFVNVLRDVGGRVLDAIMWPFNEAKRRIEEAVNFIKSKLDFTQRHSPSVLDIVQNGVKKVNRALEDLNFGVNMNADGIAASVMGSDTSTKLTSLTVVLENALIADEQSARRVSELIGNQIIDKVQANIRV